MINIHDHQGLNPRAPDIDEHLSIRALPGCNGRQLNHLAKGISGDPYFSHSLHLGSRDWEVI